MAVSAMRRIPAPPCLGGSVVERQAARLVARQRSNEAMDFVRMGPPGPRCTIRAVHSRRPRFPTVITLPPSGASRTRKDGRAMKRFALALPLTLIALTGFSGSPAVHAAGDKKAMHAGNGSKAAELRVNMRKLWEDHIVFTRNFIISAVAGLGDLQAVTERLLRNQDDIGNAIKPLYGEAAGKKLSALLRDHILIAADIVKAAKAGDSKAVDAGEKKWRGNADDIAAFLSGANPQW